MNYFLPKRATCDHVINWSLTKDDMEIEYKQSHAQSDLDCTLHKLGVLNSSPPSHQLAHLFDGLWALRLVNFCNVCI